MAWLLYLFGGGLIFFVGIALVLLGVAVLAAARGKWKRRAATIAALLGALAVALSATPVSYLWYAVAAVAALTWLVGERTQGAWLARRRKWWRAAVVAAGLCGVALELPYQFAPRIETPARPTLYVIGDSVAAGTSADDRGTWPRLLASSGVEVRDLARAGATTAGALEQAKQLPDRGGLVLLEIGGNDLLGSTTAAQFERDLDRLLSAAARPGRAVAMFELPLPPLRNEYGRVQRRLAAKHRAALIPKRLFIAVLTTDGATLDSIHLSPQGHRQMAALVRSLIEPSH